MIGISNKNSGKMILMFKKILKSNRLILFFIMLCPVFINGQAAPDFSILTDKAFQKLYQNPEECISYSQSLLISDKNIEHKVILRNIISQAYALQGNYVQSVSISNQKEDENLQGHLSRFIQLFDDYNLADQYQNLGLYGQSKKIIAGILKNPELLKSSNGKERMVLAKLFQLQAINAGITRNYDIALINIDKSDVYLDNNNEENRIIKWENIIFRSSFLLRQNKLEESKKLLDDVIRNVERYGNNAFITAFAYENLSRYFFLKEDYNTAIKHLEKGFSEIQNLPYNDLKIIFYELFARNYLALNNDKKYYDYNNLYTDQKAKLDANKKEGIQYVVKLLETYHSKNIEFERQNKLKQLRLISLVMLILIVGIVAYFFNESARGKDMKKQLDFFKKLKVKEEPVTVIIEKPKGETVQESKNPEKDPSKISKEKEEEILQKLKDWEKSDRYLNKNMSLAILSVQTGINTKYLSEVINNNKGKNFNGYINELRINHIARLLKTDPAYLNYKVSYLAEYSGFSSHGAFTNVFKSVTGMSPYTYIQEIIKNKKS
ncbi:helix-turn-helix domain-containing protein [Chryseobacterium arthrosphaerae]|uniref:helix-turn-helix domain-containing protein n=1 Tax=Chryseobacterium arthrosphaerae TaxID=651561 RepID=UPI001E42F714|nr:helix-turn-helix domain-containing protein [Chryseobacterium arthrosphaerae]UEQ76222.1 helix-turn-helix domain-containing protein [Chryseobacterium arthrosphaerae]